MTKNVVNQQAATPTSLSHSTEARVDAAAAINNNADQLASNPRRLQNSRKSWLQCWVIVNSSTGNHGALENFHLREFVLLKTVY